MTSDSISGSSAPGRVVLLNGSSSSGKTTLAQALQRHSEQPLQYLALDHFRDGMPDQIRGLNSPPGTPGHSGLNVVPRSVAGQRLTHIEFGDVGKRVLRGMRRAVQALANEGVDVVVDDILFEPAFLADYAQVLLHVPTYLVGVRCSLACVEAREAMRPGRFPGTARSHFDSVHAHGAGYDVEVDTEAMGPRDCAKRVLNRLTNAPQALTRYLAGTCFPMGSD